MDERITSQNKYNEVKNEMKNKLYRHFKGNLYRVIDVAIHSETALPLVIYQSESNPEYVWARPFDMFMSEVDHEKYPDCKQKMRFEQIEAGEIIGEQIDDYIYEFTVVVPEGIYYRWVANFENADPAYELAGKIGGIVAHNVRISHKEKR